jgi:YggT family protein
MFIIANLFLAIAKIIDILVSLYILAIIVRVILSWIQFDPSNSIVRFTYEITEPALMRVRRLVPLFGDLDLSPLVLIFVLYILEGFIVNTLQDFAMVLK